MLICLYFQVQTFQVDKVWMKILPPHRRNLLQGIHQSVEDCYHHLQVLQMKLSLNRSNQHYTDQLQLSSQEFRSSGRLNSLCIHFLLWAQFYYQMYQQDKVSSVHHFQIL